MNPALILGAVFIGVFGLIVIVGFVSSRRSSPLRERAVELTESERLSRKAAPAGSPARAGVKGEIFPLLSRLLSNRNFIKRYEAKLITAGIPLRGTEFAAIVATCVLVLSCLVGAILLKSIPWAIGLGVLGWFLPNKVVDYLRDRRRNQLEVQLADALTVVSASLGAGYGFLQGAKLASEQMPPPISEELDRVVRLSSMGMPIEQALQSMAQRAQSYDFDITVSAVNIQLRRGGNLTRLLDIVADTIRERIDLRGEIAGLTAQARLSGWILMALPLIVGLLMFGINPEYAKVLFATQIGHKILLVAGALQLMGMFMIRKMLQIEL